MPFSMTLREYHVLRILHVCYSYYWLGGWSDGHDKDLSLLRVCQMARRVRSTLPEMFTTRILSTLPCLTGPFPALRTAEGSRLILSVVLKEWARVCIEAELCERKRCEDGKSISKGFMFLSKLSLGINYQSLYLGRYLWKVLLEPAISPIIGRHTESSGTKWSEAECELTLGSAIHHFGCAEVIICPL